MASICVETMKHQRVERDLDNMVVMASQTTKSVVIFGDLFFCLKESDEAIASICAETMKRQQAERDLNDKVVMGEGHHTCAALLHHVEVHYKQVSRSSCPPLSHSRPSVGVALRF
jgi:4-hydroxy-3-methylbut-2-enyl diphosphate reductase IspH